MSGTDGCGWMRMWTPTHIWVTGNHSKLRCPPSPQGQGGHKNSYPFNSTWYTMYMHSFWQQQYVCCHHDMLYGECNNYSQNYYLHWDFPFNASQQIPMHENMTNLNICMTQPHNKSIHLIVYVLLMCHSLLWDWDDAVTFKYHCFNQILA